jgi:2-polyprenyl-3-methyl-5-hydroxy-6-metoxy-1,4-benzoquinol methylase
MRQKYPTAQVYETLFGDYTDDLPALNTAIQVTHNKGKALDVGSGNRRLTKILEKHFTSVKTVDPNRQKVDYRYIGDVRGKYDFICMGFHVTNHLSDVDEALQIFAKLLNPGGQVYLDLMTPREVYWCKHGWAYHAQFNATTMKKETRVFNNSTLFYYEKYYHDYESVALKAAQLYNLETIVSDSQKRYLVIRKT